MAYCKYAAGNIAYFKGADFKSRTQKKLKLMQVNLHKAKLATVELTKLFLDANSDGQGQGGKVKADKPGVIFISAGGICTEQWQTIQRGLECRPP